MVFVPLLDHLEKVVKVLGLILDEDLVLGIHILCDDVHMFLAVTDDTRPVLEGEDQFEGVIVGMGHKVFHHILVVLIVIHNQDKQVDSEFFDFVQHSLSIDSTTKIILFFDNSKLFRSFCLEIVSVTELI